MLILSGGGDPEQVVPIDKFFANSIDKAKLVIYIPVAMEKTVFTYEQCFECFKSVYEPFGIVNIQMCTSLSDLKLNNKIAAVFIGGGNAYKLLKEVKETSFDKELLNYLANGGVVYGGSAGAMIFGMTIETEIHTGSENYGFEDLSALDCLNGYDIWCHYKPEEDNLISEYMNSLYVLSEESGLVCENGKITAIGAEYVRIDKKQGGQ